MLVKFLPTYTGGGLGSINYLLNERKAAGTAKVVKGDENLTRAVIKGVTYKQKTCFGVLSFEEKHDFLNEEQKLIKDFERALLGDYMLERTNRLCRAFGQEWPVGTKFFNSKNRFGERQIV